ncbi:MAG: hypothetical protein HC897_08325 [Thermoanaerobaculia bacterium]|nr:hypothetical protein [Thermoanaerobaculia bacterium]
MRRRDRDPWLAGLLTGLVWLASAPAANAEWKLQSEDGKQSIKFGFLAQLRAESIDTADGEDTTTDLFFRRLRLMAGGKLSDKWSFFFETDSPNLGKSNAAGEKTTDEFFIQDFYVSYKHSDAVQVDVGLILIPLSHNSTQSAVTLLPSGDYGPYSFLNSGPTRSKVGRDYGVQLRGYLAESHFEYRLGVYDGFRGPNSTNALRWAGRVVYHVFEPETGMFYTGTTLGAKRHLSFGASVDTQEDYQAVAFDVFWDQPTSDGDAFTFQADVINYDGDVFFPTLPDQDASLVELGYWFSKSRLQPYVQYAQRDFAGAGADEDSLAVGLNYRMAKHNRVLRFEYNQLTRDGAPDRDRFLVNFQVFSF